MLKQVQHNEAGEGTPFAPLFPSRPSRETKQGKVHAGARRTQRGFDKLSLSAGGAMVPTPHPTLVILNLFQDNGSVTT